MESKTTSFEYKIERFYASTENGEMHWTEMNQEKTPLYDI